jgi:hypothetical protein
MAARLYGRLYRHGRRLGAPAQKDETPFEFALALREHLANLPIKSFAQKSMQQAGLGIADLTNIYVRTQYSAEDLGDNDKERTLAIWQRLRRQLTLARLLYWLRKFKPKKTTQETKTLE